MNTHETFMARALELAKKGMGFVSPNPMVGAVIVKNGKSIGEGLHKKYGKAHAEANAIADAEAKGYSVEDTEMYVTLEPCSHHGKTPPCADLIIEKKIKKVFVATKDPNPAAAGGIEKLQKAGIKVQTGFLENEAKNQNRFFFHGIAKKRPFFLGKIAIDANGFVSEKKGVQTKITGQEAQKFTHQLRMKCDAILIGAETAIIDNPLLSVRYGDKRRDPLRIILDPKERVPKNNRVFRDENYYLGTKQTNESGFLDLSELAKKLYEKGIISVLIEGGPKTLEQFIQQNLLDEMIVIQSEKNIGKNDAPRFPIKILNKWRKTKERKLGKNSLQQYEKGVNSIPKF